MSTLHVVVPAGVDDASRPSGGNTYDREVCAGLVGRGWQVTVREAVGRWPDADLASRTALGASLASVPDASVVLIDGLVASAVPEVLVPERRRLRLVVLVHLPLGHAPALRQGDTRADASGTPDGVDERARERAVLQAAAAVVVTSRWTRDWLLATYVLAPDRVSVVTPGVARAPVVLGCEPGRHLLCMGSVSPTKGHDLLVSALADSADLEWTCRCVGSVDVDPAFSGRVRDQARRTGLGARLSLPGPRVGADLDAVYAAADLVIAPSRVETYGMAVTEALARGIPVIGSDVGGLREALVGPPGRSPGGRRPGILVPPNDPAPLSVVLHRWLTDAGFRHDLRRGARERRATLDDWSLTTDRLARVLSGVAA